MERSLWGEAFSLERPPKFPCPFCSWEFHGRLQPDTASLRIEDSPRAREFRQRSGGVAIFPWQRSRFQLTMRCEEPLCGEVVAVAGTVAPWETEINGRVLKYGEALYPAFFYRAPPIIEVLGALGGDITLTIMKSFDLFWVDLEACANCLRRSIEAIVDDFYVPRTRENGGPMPLKWRIQQFANLSEPVVAHDVAESFRKLAELGDFGSHHGNTIERDYILDAYELLEKCESSLYGNDGERVEELRARLGEVRNQT